jgi:CRISPR/Cas system endoribonuclease Cas6 (RAMP superfamily)
VVTPGSSTKKPYSDVASNLSKAFKGDGARNAALEKEGKIFVQVPYPDNVFTAGLSFTTLYIKVVQYKGGEVVPVWYCKNIFFTAAFK